MLNHTMPRPEHPKPQFMRQNWMNLNGEWQFEKDQSRSGRERGLFQETAALDGRIIVPFCPESRLSGLEDKDFMNGVWYKRRVTLEKNDGLTRLHFGAADYHTFVYVNSQLAGEHKGGYVSFFVDITPFVREGENDITVYCEDDARDPMIPSGKQSDRFDSYGCMYTRTTGIWQTVWLEFLPKTHIESVKYDTNITDVSVTVTAALSGQAPLDAMVSFAGRTVGTYHNDVAAGVLTFTVPLTEKHLWDVGQGNLYDVALSFGDDHVNGYFGLRTVRFDGMHFMLNDRPVFQRLVLDQGFYPDGIYTAPSDAALENDIRLSMTAGFNGARLHEKIFEERFLYHADRLGYLVWGEYPDWGLDHSDPMNVYSILPEWTEEILRDRNHPAIIGWCPHNETWDHAFRRQDNDAIRLLYRTTKALDPTRPCIDTSGNFHVETDVFCLHDYDQNPETFGARYSPLAEGKAPVDRFSDRQNYHGEPVMISEYGGIGWIVDTAEWGHAAGQGWGYGNGPKTIEEFYERFRGLTDALLDNPALFGLCYTQLTDVEQERNGVYTYQRQAKFDTELLRAILTRKAKIEEEK